MKILRETSEKYGYSARVIHKLLRLARTSADLDGEEKIRRKDIEKVLTCRDLDKSIICARQKLKILLRNLRKGWTGKNMMMRKRL